MCVRVRAWVRVCMRACACKLALDLADVSMHGRFLVCESVCECKVARVLRMQFSPYFWSQFDFLPDDKIMRVDE